MCRPRSTLTCIKPPRLAISRLTRMKLDGNQASIRDAIDAGLLAGAVTLVWRPGEVLQVNELGHRDVDAAAADAARHHLPHRLDDQAGDLAAAMMLIEEGKLALTTRSPNGCPSSPTCRC